MPRVFRSFVSVAACASWFVTLLVPAFAQNAGTDVATVIDVDGKQHAGPLTAVTDGKLSIGGREPRVFATADLLRVQFEKRHAHAVLRGSIILLANGDRLVARPLSMDDESLVAAWMNFPAWAEVKVPLSTIRGIVMKVPQTRTVRAGVVKTLLDRRAKSDVVILDNGDRVTGELLGLDQNGFSLSTAVGKIDIQRTSVRAVGFNADLISFPQTNQPRVLLRLSDGSRITVRNPALDATGLLRCEPLFGAKLQIPSSSVVSLRFLGGRSVYLSDLEPVRYHFTPFLSTRWELRKDRNVAGGPLRLRGVEYAKGLGLHSKSEVTYDLGGRYRRFQATVGIDDGTGGLGSAVFAVLVDGKQVVSSGPLTGNSQPRLIGPIDLSAAKQMTLLVDFGDFGDIQDHADWCDAVLIR